MAKFETRKSGYAAKAMTVAMRQARMSKRAPETVVTRSGHVKNVSVSRMGTVR